MQAKTLLRKGIKIPFKYETNSPYALPIIPGLRQAIAELRRAGMRIEYCLRLEHRYFVYYVQAKTN